MTHRHLSFHLTKVGGFDAHPFPVQSCSSWRSCWGLKPEILMSVIASLVWSVDELWWIWISNTDAINIWEVISTLEVAVVPTSQGPVASEGFIMALAAKMRFTEGTTAAAHRQEPVRGPKKNRGIVRSLGQQYYLYSTIYQYPEGT